MPDYEQRVDDEALDLVTLEVRLLDAAGGELKGSRHDVPAKVAERVFDALTLDDLPEEVSYFQEEDDNE